MSLHALSHTEMNIFKKYVSLWITFFIISNLFLTSLYIGLLSDLLDPLLMLLLEIIGGSTAYFESLLWLKYIKYKWHCCHSICTRLHAIRTVFKLHYVTLSEYILRADTTNYFHYQQSANNSFCLFVF